MAVWSGGEPRAAVDRRRRAAPLGTDLRLTQRHARCRDNLRGFFEQCFPTLLRRLFGYDGSSWLTAVAKVRRGRPPRRQLHLERALSGPLRSLHIARIHPQDSSPPLPLTCLPIAPARVARRRTPRRFSSCSRPRACCSAPATLRTPTASSGLSSPTSGYPHTHRQGRGWAAMLGPTSQPATASTLQRRSAAAPSLHPACPARLWHTPPPACFGAATPSQMMLAAAAGRAELERWPQYAGALVYDSSGKAHIHVGVFQYFVFWTAFYVLKVGRAWLLGWAVGCVGSELEAWSWDCGGRDVCSACLQAGVCARISAQCAACARVRMWGRGARTLVQYDGPSSTCQWCGWLSADCLQGGDAGGIEAAIRSRGVGLTDSVRKVWRQQGQRSRAAAERSAEQERCPPACHVEAGACCGPHNPTHPEHLACRRLTRCT